MHFYKKQRAMGDRMHIKKLLFIGFLWSGLFAGTKLCDSEEPVVLMIFEHLSQDFLVWKEANASDLPIDLGLQVCAFVGFVCFPKNSTRFKKFLLDCRECDLELKSKRKSIFAFCHALLLEAMQSKSFHATSFAEHLSIFLRQNNITMSADVFEDLCRELIYLMRNYLSRFL